jgi:hypothetical protein
MSVRPSKLAPGFQRVGPSPQRSPLPQYVMSSSNSSNSDPNPENDSSNLAIRAARSKEHDAVNISQIWIDKLPETEGTRFFKSISWAATTLGLPQTWSASLRFAVNLLFTDSRGACIYWSEFSIIPRAADSDCSTGVTKGWQSTMKFTSQWRASLIRILWENRLW